MVCVSVPTAAVAGEGLADAGAVAGADALGTAAVGAGADAAGSAAALDAAGSGLGAIGAGLGGGADALAASSPLDALLGGITAGATDATVPAFADIGGDTALTGLGDAATSAGGAAVDGFGNPIVTGSAGDLLGTAANPAVDSSGVSQLATAGTGGASGGADAPGGSSWLSQLGKNAAKNPLNAALAGGSVLSGIQSLIPRKQVNTQQNAADVLATNPQFNNPNLPKYTMQNTATPYSGDWYTYGQKPEAAMYNAQPIPAAKRGGMIGHYAQGGMIRGYADGGSVNTINAGYLPSGSYSFDPRSGQYIPTDASADEGGHTMYNLSPQQYQNEVAFEGGGGQSPSSSGAAPTTPATAPAPPIGPAPAVNMNNIAQSGSGMPTASPSQPMAQSVNPLNMIGQPQGMQPGGGQMPMQGGQPPMQGGTGAPDFNQIFGSIARAVQQNQGTGHARGGLIHKFAMGGPVPGQPPMGMPSAPPMGAPPPQMPPQGMGAPPPRPLMQPPQQAKKPINPLALNMAAHKIGMAIGKHMKHRGMTPDGRVKGHGGGQDDIVPARLSKDEFVIPADVTAALGDGSSEAGGQKLHALMDNVRKHKTGSTKYPPKAKNPLAYLPKGKS